MLASSPALGLRLFRIKYLMPLATRGGSIYLRLHNAVKNRIDRYWKERADLKSLGRRHAQIRAGLAHGYRLRIEDFGLQQERLAEVERLLQGQRELIIADIDQDGFIISRFGPIDSVPTVAREEFIDRGRFNLHVVAIDGYVGIKKNYRGQIRPFLREFQALYRLAREGCNVPALLDVDFDELVVVLSYIPGSILREELAKNGAVLRDRDVLSREDLMAMRLRDRMNWIIDEGLRYLYDTVSPEFVAQLFGELQKVHTAKYIWGDIKHGNVLIEASTGAPFLIDFDSSASYPGLPQWLFREMRIQDIQKFNRLFATNELTDRGLREKIRELERDGHIESPVYFAAGIAMGDISSRTAGYGYWHTVLKHRLPPLAGKRVIDVGTQNGYECIQMLRGGASEAIAIVLDDDGESQTEFVRKAFEYLDNRPYSMRYLRAGSAEMLDLPDADFMLARLSALQSLADTPVPLARLIAERAATCIVCIDEEATASWSTNPSCARDFRESLVAAFRDAGFAAARLVGSGRGAGSLLIAEKG